jgi:hypothetical protein
MPDGKNLYPSFYRKSTKQGVFATGRPAGDAAASVRKEEIRRHRVPVAEEDFQNPVMTRACRSNR